MHSAPGFLLPKPLPTPSLLERREPAPFLPMTRAEMTALGWDRCDVVLITGDAYVDHPSFGMALVGRLLEAHGLRVGIIAQPDWHSAVDFRRLGRPGLFFGVTAGNMDSMVNRYTSERRTRNDDAYTPDGQPGRRPDRAVMVYAQRCREAFHGVPVVLGGIEASLRRIAHFDYWSEKVRRSVLLDAKAELLLYGNAERALVALASRLAGGEAIAEITDLRGSAYLRRGLPLGWEESDATEVDRPRSVERRYPDPYASGQRCAIGQGSASAGPAPGRSSDLRAGRRTVVRLPSFEQVASDPTLYAHASRVFHLETNPGNARPLVQAHGDRDLWLNPPPVPLTSAELDQIYELPYARAPHPRYRGCRIPAWEMIRFSVNIMRGCFGGCTFCSITEHEGRVIQSRSEGSVLREIERIRDHTPGFTGVISDLGGPTANMYRMRCRSKQIEEVCRRLSCVHPGICRNLITDHGPLCDLYRRARRVRGVKKVLIASGLRYDLALRSAEYVRELVTHHVGGYLKVAPEHSEPGPLGKMMKPGIDAFAEFKELFDRFSREAGKQQYLIPYFISGHPGTSDEDMLQLSLWLKRNGFRVDQVQSFLPTPLALASAMYHSGKNPLHRVGRESESVFTVKGLRRRRLHKAFLRYHDRENWPLLRAALKRMGRADLIGHGKDDLVPPKRGDRARGSEPSIAPKRRGRRPSRSRRSRG